MKKLRANKKLHIMTFFILTVILFLYAFPVIAANEQFRIEYGGTNYSGERDFVDSNILFAILMEDLDEVASLNEEITYTNSVSGTYVDSRNDKQNYSANITMRGKLVEVDELFDERPFGHNEIMFMGTMDFDLEIIGYYSYNYEEEAVITHRHSFSGPFHVPGIIRNDVFENRTQVTYIGYDLVNVKEDQQVPVKAYYSGVGGGPSHHDNERHYEIPAGQTSASAYSPHSIRFKIHQISDTAGVIIDTEAADIAGDTDYSVPAALVVGAAGMAAAVGAVGAAGAAGGAAGASGGGASGAGVSEGSSTKKEEKESTYKMVLYKDFGNEIIFDSEYVYVYAKMVEVKPTGEEIPRPDLTLMIEIFSEDSFMEIGTASVSGEYMGASVRAISPDPEDLVLEVNKDRAGFLMETKASETIEVNLPQSYRKGVISFRFNGEGGIFQNNVSFNLVEEEWEFEAGLRFERDEGIVDFEIEKENSNKAILNITEATKDIDKKAPYQSAEIKIIARSSKGEAIRHVNALVYQEGLFLMDIKVGKNDDGTYRIKADGEKEKLPVQLRALEWNEETKRVENNPDLLLPERLKIEIEPKDDKGKKAMEVGQLNHINHANGKSFSVYHFYIENEIPGGGINLNVPVKFLVTGMGNENFTEEIVLRVETTEMMPLDREKEIERCKYIIDKFVPDSYKDKMHEIVDRRAPVLGPEGMYELRRKVWDIAQLLTLGEGGQGYLDEAKWADRIVGVLEWAEWAGDHCFNAVVKVKLGPAGEKIAPLVKGLMIDSIKAYCYEGLDPITWSQNYMNQALANFDLANISKLAAEKGWEAVAEDLKERDITIKGRTWSVRIPGWLAVKGITSIRTFVTLWVYEGKSIYEAATQTTWDLADDKIGSSLEDALKKG